ncbi:triose-phosphate isomerase [Enterobacteriaceae bacterium H11S18]|uniref:triose-phosphate isomerase family protein n=1 Tax=Dryocola clanedunensis TaxID=2925396 RepID=UPI0022EFDFA7|nr:triose-phosphate isomerase family protein [Dryocola clanedunensis]MCT4706682.1 triose-phosphate isomerase [Dryocola clanedunensis]MCT4712209.1 triose-phosphate isomerase [Dryocola clanedunensis]
MSRLTLGVSHKTYLGSWQTQIWCEHIAGVLSQPYYQRHSAGLSLFTFPAMPALARAVQAFSGTAMGVGAQNISAHPPGAWTGESSAAMVSEMGCRYAEIGHAERRNHFHESVDVIEQKVLRAIEHRLIPVICIGESQPLSGKAATAEAIRQACELLDRLPEGHRSPLIFAWEPQWAIGADACADTHYIRTVCRNLRAHLHQNYLMPTRVIYGGSAGPGLLSQLWPDVDGLFLGRFVHCTSGFQAVLEEAIELLYGTESNPG